MSNDALRAALQNAGLRPDDLADILQVDVKTVRRWLGGMTPYPRHRGKVARALDTTEQTLWPDVAAPTPKAGSVSDLVASYPTTDDPSAPDWQQLLAGATERIDLLDETLGHVFDLDGLGDMLAAKANQGCLIRVMISDPGSPWHEHLEGFSHFGEPDDEDEREQRAQEIEARIDEWEDANTRTYELLQPLTRYPGLQARKNIAARFHSILRFDDDMLVTVHLWAQPTLKAPLLHLHRQSTDGLFDRFAEHFDGIWRDAGRPIEPADRDDIAPDAEPKPTPPPDGLSTDADALGAPRDQLTQVERTPGSDQPRPRRWPGRDA